VSTLKVNNLQVGQDATSTNNFTLYQPPVPDGTVRLGVGNVGGVTDILTVDSAGEVGIGTTNPVTKLSVWGGITTLTNGAKSTSNPYLRLLTSDSVNQMSLSFANITNSCWQIQSTEEDVNWRNLVLNPSGANVGIGTTNPLSKLNISASSGGDTSGLRITRTDAGGGDWRIWSSANVNGEGGGKLIIGNSGNRVIIDSSGNVGIGTTNPIKPFDLRGEACFGSGVTTGDLYWGKDTNQLVYTFSGTASGVNPADGVIAVVNPNINPNASRIGSIVFGNKIGGTVGTNNPGLKAGIDAYTNTNVAAAGDTGAYINFYTKPDNGSYRVQMTLNSNGVFTKPYQPAFLAFRNSVLSITNTWQLISNGILSEAYDVGSVYSTSTNGRFVAPVAGKYMFYAGGYSAGNSNGERYAFGVKVNNTGSPDLITGGNYCIADSPLSPYQVVLNLAANDYVELFFFSAINTSLGGPHWLYWGGYLLG
jgi:hypothetical protein